MENHLVYPKSACSEFSDFPYLCSNITVCYYVTCILLIKYMWIIGLQFLASKCFKNYAHFRDN